MCRLKPGSIQVTGKGLTLLVPALCGVGSQKSKKIFFLAISPFKQFFQESFPKINFF
jgi:hypothetical protein